MNAHKEYLEAKLLDLLDGKLTTDQELELRVEVAKYPDLKTQLEFIDNEPLTAFLSESYKKGLERRHDISTSQLTKIEKVLDQEWVIQDSIPQISRMIYRVIIPALAASLLLFFQWGSRYIEPNEQNMNSFDFGGQTELANFERSLSTYAGIEELDELMNALDTIQN